jgi:hypothetical protein
MSDVAILHDLRYRFGPPRDQGPRPTCLAFAVSDSHAAVREDWEPLSCEYLYYHAIRRDGSGPEKGAKPSAILAAVENDGQPAEVGWPYFAKLPDAANWLPPADVGEVFRRTGETIGGSFNEAWSLVAAGRPAVICMTLSDGFYLPLKGIVDSTEPPEVARRHAVIAVAAGKRDTFRFLLVRNSWGPEWGEAGHAWISETYLAPRVIRILALKELA